VSNIIVKHRDGLVTDCHRLPIVPIVPQSSPMVSVADVSVKLYHSITMYHGHEQVMSSKDFLCFMEFLRL